MKKERFFNITYNVLAIIVAVFILTFGLIAVNKHLYPLKQKELVIKYADEYLLDRALIFAVIKVESDFENTAVSKKGAIGLMQIKNQTGEYIAMLLGEKTFDLTNAETNVKYGCYYIRYLIDRFKNKYTAIIAYNAGEGNVSAWLKNKRYSKDGVSLISTPFNETNEYLKKIKKSFSKYKKLYPNILDKRVFFE